jgi:4-amino-4-deoxy-L-arabinose transferase-like glycosyltransferase
VNRASGEPRRGEREFLWALAIVALLPRLFVALSWSREPVWDGHYYHFGAERIAQGLGYSEDVWSGGQLVWKPWVHYPVGYSALLGFFYWVFGPNLLIAPLLNVALGVFMTLATYALARRGLDETRARVAGGLVALHPGLIAQSALVMTELLAGTLLVAAGVLALRTRPGARLFPFGLTLGLATLVRPASLLLAPVALLLRRHTLGVVLRGAALMLAGAAVVILPWTLRNCARLDGCALVSTNGGWNLAIGALTETGRFTTLRASDGCPAVTGQVQQDRCWAEVGLRKITAAPGRWLELAPKKLAETFNHESFAIEYLHEADPKGWPEARRVAGRALTSGAHRALFLVAALSMLAFPGRLRGAARYVQSGLLMAVVAFGTYAFLDDSHPFYAFSLFIPVIALLPLPGRPAFAPCLRYAAGALFVTALTHVAFFGEDRYHLVVSPLLCLLAAAALRRTPPESAAPRDV